MCSITHRQVGVAEGSGQVGDPDEVQEACEAKTLEGSWDGWEAGLGLDACIQEQRFLVLAHACKQVRGATFGERGEL